MLTRDFVRVLPKAEVHLHLEGAVPWAMVRAHAGDDLPERPPWSGEGFRFDDFTQFRGASLTCMGCLVDARAYGAVTGAIFRDLAAQNVRYVEISFSGGSTLDAGQTSSEMLITVDRLSGIYVEKGSDYSYDESKSWPSFADWTHVTLYRNGTLVYGTEP